jgi:hypothetical protein
MKTYETLSEAMIALKASGYKDDLKLGADSIECQSRNVRLRPEDFHVDQVHRFEGMTNPDDSAVMYAISSPKGVKGLLVDAYGAYADSISPAMIDKLRIDGRTDRVAEQRSAEEIKEKELNATDKKSS